MFRASLPLLIALLLVSTLALGTPIKSSYSLPPETEIFTLEVSRDSFLKQGSEKDNEGSNIILDLQSSDKHRPVIAFNQTQLVEVVENSIVQSAVLKLYVSDNGNNWGPSGNSIGVYRLLANWAEGNGWNQENNVAGAGSGVTWACAIDSDISNNNNDCSTQWNGGSFQTPAADSVLITSDVVNQWVELDVTSDIIAFLDGSATNYG